MADDFNSSVLLMTDQGASGGEPYSLAGTATVDRLA
jgi:hypothetical protein